MNRAQKVALTVGALLAVAALIYPWWRGSVVDLFAVPRGGAFDRAYDVDLGRAPVFRPPMGGGRDVWLRDGRVVPPPAPSASRRFDSESLAKVFGKQEKLKLASAQIDISRLLAELAIIALLTGIGFIWATRRPRSYQGRGQN